MISVDANDHDKAGRSTVKPIRCCIVEAVSVRIDHDIIHTKRERGMPDEHRTHIAIHDGYGLDRTCDIRRDLIAIVPVLIMDYVDVHVRARGEA
ncbi:MAG: hypothetical protein C5S48_07325 [Candidatus Methanogaster sp.]|nr:MAG: hypothetical protein C5S48_07325 [ANME-2 cluster archaeon]